MAFTHHFRLLAVAAAVSTSLSAAGQSIVDAVPAAPGADDGVPVVLTATKLKQAQRDAPASVTILTGEMLRRYGVRQVVEAMRFVPGMEVTLADGNQYQVNYHGTSVTNPRRINVMIDNVSMYQTTISEVRWDTLPVTIEDVERIEVVRGATGSATYGPNSTLAVVNIITRHAADSAGLYVAADAGNNDNRRAMVRYGFHAGESDVRTTFEHFENGGFDLSSGNAKQPAYSNNLETNRLTLSAETRISEMTELHTSAAVYDADRGFSRPDARAISSGPVYTEAWYLDLTLNYQISADHEVSVRAYGSSTSQRQQWRTFAPEAAVLPQMFNLYLANPQYANTILSGKIPTGGTAQDNLLAMQALAAIKKLGKNAAAPVDFTVNQNYREHRFEVDGQDTYVFSPQLRTVASVGARYNEGSSETFFNGDVDNLVIWAAGNLEYKPTDIISLNVGGYGEHSGIAGSDFVPRLALNAKVNEQSSVRVVYAQGMRLPDLHEQKSYWTYTGRNASDPAFEGAKLYQSGISTNTLDDEKVDSYEVGYFGAASEYGLTADVRGFYERLYHLVSERLSIGTFNPSNQGKVNLSGIEMQIKADPTANLNVFATYTYLVNDAPIGSTERGQYARNSGSVGASYLFSHGFRLSGDFAMQTSEVPQTRGNGRIDLIAARSFKLGNSDAEITAQVRRLDSSQFLWLRGNTPVVYQYPSRYQFQIGARLGF